MKDRPGRRPLDDDAAFQSLISDVVPLPPSNRMTAERPRPRPVPRRRTRDEHEALDHGLGDWTPWEAGYETGADLVYARPGVQARAMRQLRRGLWPVEAALDLHGLSSEQARLAFAAFLARCRRDRLRCVRIVHGKGYGSPNREPVLKRKVAGWLMQRDEVLAFHQARHAEGGGGAVVVLLKA